MEHTATSTRQRVDKDVEVGVESLANWPQHPKRIDDGSPTTPNTARNSSHWSVHQLVREGPIVLLLAFGVYLVVAILLDFKYRTYPLDSFARMANGFYILYSRDPHLAAVGFVWDPLSSLADMVFLIGNHLWPALSHNNMAGSLTSSLSMAGAAFQMCAALREWGVSRTPRLVLTAFFVLNPMIIYYGANGMSEGLYLFTLIAATRYLLRWMRDGDLRSLAYGAVALGFCYLTRNEAAFAALLGAAAVGAVSYGRAEGRRPSRVRTATSDLVIFGLPAFTAALGWAVVSYVITGEFFAQVQSIYGSAAQEASLGHKTVHGRVLYEFHAIAGLAPFLPILVVAATAVALMRRDPRMLAPLTVLGGALGFDMVLYMDNGIQDYMRYWIVAVPLGIMLLGSVAAAVQPPRQVQDRRVVRTRTSRSNVRLLGSLAASCLALIVMIPTTATTASAMMNPNLGVEEDRQIGYIFKAHPNQVELVYPKAYRQSLALGNYFASLHLPDGDIVVDNSAPCVPLMIVTSSQPKLFVIPNDRDFQRILADPISFHTHYILEPDPSSTSVSAPNNSYPSLWSTGAGFTMTVHRFPAGGPCPEFRLFHVVKHSNTLT